MKNFSLKFIDIMIGVILGLGFQSWSLFKEPWQYIAYIFAYIDIIDYWIDYAPSLKKFPPMREINLFLDLGIMFSLFLIIYSTQISIIYFIMSFILLRILDFIWLSDAKRNYNPIGTDKIFVETWLAIDLIELVTSGLLLGLTLIFSIPPLIVIINFILLRIVTRLISIIRYKKVHFA